MDEDERADQLYDLYKDDGWTNDDLMRRRHLSGGRYVGPKDNPTNPEDAA